MLTPILVRKLSRNVRTQPAQRIEYLCQKRTSAGAKPTSLSLRPQSGLCLSSLCQRKKDHIVRKSITGSSMRSLSVIHKGFLGWMRLLSLWETQRFFSRWKTTEGIWIWCLRRKTRKKPFSQAVPKLIGLIKYSLCLWLYPKRFSVPWTCYIIIL